MSDFLNMRHNMVSQQLMPEGVTNSRVLDAFLVTPRENFVPLQLARIAYMDAHFPLQKGRFLLRPAILGRLLEALNPQPLDKILYIAAGTGYGPVLLSYMASHVIALDEETSFTQEAERLSRDLNLSSMEVVLGPLKKGWAKEAPYDKIFIEGCVDEIPSQLTAQLQDKGQLIAVKAYQDKKKSAVRIEKTQETLTEIFLFDAFVPRLSAFKEDEPFVF